ncbi:glycosyltransferase family 1 protein [Cloacibacterium normanense]|uniref:glycosyltransferase family 1 protein n=1 Tax=Cloacibacterium normanense TaxID=237258 RepID=UPI003919A1FD
MQPIKILQIFTVLNKGGAETNLMNYYRNMDRSQFQIDFLVHRETGFFEDELIKSGSKIFRLPAILPWKLKEYKKAVKNFFDEHNDFDIVHGQCSELGVFIYEEAKRRGIPVIIAHAHNNRMDRDKKLVFRLMWKKRMRKSINAYFTCGKEAAENLFGKKLAEKSYQMNNAIEVEDFQFNQEVREKKRKELQAEETINLVNIGRFNTQKNQSFLLEVFAELIKLNKKYKLFLVGQGELESQLREKAKQLQIEQDVEFLGLRNDVPELLQAMDVFLFPSLHEGFSVAFVEAQTTDIKAVISDGVPQESILIPENVTVIPLKNSALQWAEKIAEINNFERKNVAALIKEKGYDIKENAQKLEKKYKELIQQYKKIPTLYHPNQNQ